MTHPPACDFRLLDQTLRTFASEATGPLCKGLPPAFHGRFSDIAAAGFRLGDNRLPSPVAVLREDAMARNRAWMAAFLRATGVDLAPHGKTSMSPDLFAMQMRDGVWGLTAASAQHLAFYAAIGIRRVIVANQIAGAGNIAALMETLAAYPELEVHILADSRDNVDQLARALPPGARLRLLVEIGVTGGRTGLRDPAEALALARHIAATPGLILSGIEGYEGIVPGDDLTTREAAVTAMMRAIRALADTCEAEGLWGGAEIVLTAGGTEFFDLCQSGLDGFAASRPVRVVIRSGCYITTDSISCVHAFRRILERSPEAAALPVPPPEAALEVWAAVQSRPEPGLAFATLGKRDVSHDWDMPVPVKWLPRGETVPRALSGHRVLRLNDQHAYLEIPPDSPVAVGDLIGFGISHACTTFDKWRCLLTVNGDYRVTGAVRTFF